jgi:hypothetical protein
MPDEKDETKADEETIPETSLHAHGEGREEDIEGQVGGGHEEGAETARNTGGATSGGPAGEAAGDDDPSEVEDPPEAKDANA